MDDTRPLPPSHRRHWFSMPNGTRKASARDNGTDQTFNPTIRRSPSPEAAPTTQQLLSSDSAQSSQRSKNARTIATALPTRRRAHLLQNWWLEISACFIFVVALIAIIVTLRPHQDKPLPQWPYHISVNSLIAIYVVIIKGAVLLVTAEGLGQLKWRWFKQDHPLQDIVRYDSATRGPLGALKLLWRLGLRHPLSSCGAVIIIFMLVIDPFAQQIIRYYGCSLPVQGQQATIPRTNVYVSDGTHVGAGMVSISPELQSAINAGIFSPGGLVTPGCPTGNCSFVQSYSTVGYCGGCTDITGDLKFINLNNTSGHQEDAESFTDTEASILSYLPSGTEVNSTSMDASDDDSTYSPAWNLAIMNYTIEENDSSKDPLGNERVEFILAKNPYYRDPVSAELSETLNDTCQSGNDTWPCNGYGAASCTFNPCVRTYKGAVSAGTFSETWISDDIDIWGGAMKTSGEYYLGTVDTECINPFERSSLVAAGYVLDPNSRWLPYNISFDTAPAANSTFPSSMLENGCLYAIDLFLTMSLWPEYLTHFFNGTIYGAMEENYETIKISGPQNLQTIYNYGNVTFDRLNDIFHNISDTMTTYIRQAGQVNQSKPAVGAVMHSDTCLQVRWGWLALPAILVVMTIIFFTAMVIETRPTGERAQIWKSSPLAFIFHGLEDPNRLHADHTLQEISEMESTAKRITVRLANTDTGVNLVAVEDGTGSRKLMEGHS